MQIPQYQVTEQINDHTVRVDPFMMKQKFYGPDSAQSIPAYKIAQSFETYNPTNGVPNRPLPIEFSFVSAQPQAQANSAPVAAPLIQNYGQLANQVPPQQQLADTYGLPIGNQPQLQQHLLQQQSMLHNVPVVYNPTYLVTQSNNLLKQHREQLFKPAPAFLGTINQSPLTDAQPLQDVNSVASPGQLAEAAHDQQKNEDHAQQPHSQSQSHTQTHTQSHTQTQNQALQNSISLRPDFVSNGQQIDNTPSFQRYVADRPATNGIIVQQPILTESELNSLLSIGGHDNDGQNRFIASTFYQTQPDPQIEIDNRQRQQFNDITIAKANQEINQKVNTVEVNTMRTNSRKKTAHQEHQEKLAEQFSNKTPLRIIVPDEEYAKVIQFKFH